MNSASADSRNVFLVGPMGSGKSAVGRRLAEELKRRFYDSDEEIVARTGVDIAFIFEKEGEAGFRRRERAIIDELTAQQGIVLATGGGAPVHPSNRKRLAARGTVVYLYTTVPEQLRRTGKSSHRPLLRVDEPAAVLTELMAVRDPIYREIADIVIETDGRRVPGVAREIGKRLKALAAEDPGASTQKK